MCGLAGSSEPFSPVALGGLPHGAADSWGSMAAQGPTWPHSCQAVGAGSRGTSVLLHSLSLSGTALALWPLRRPELPAVVFQEGEPEAGRSLVSEVKRGAVRCFHILLVKASPRLVQRWKGMTLPPRGQRGKVILRKDTERVGRLS